MLISSKAFNISSILIPNNIVYTIRLNDNKKYIWIKKKYKNNIKLKFNNLRNIETSKLNFKVNGTPLNKTTEIINSTEINVYLFNKPYKLFIHLVLSFL